MSADKNTQKTSLGFRKSIIESVSTITKFGTNGDMWGCQVVMENADTFGFYSNMKHQVEVFRKGICLGYEYVREIDYPGIKDKEKIKYRIQNYTLLVPRSEIFEGQIVDRIANSILESAKLAAEKGIDTEFENRANKVYAYLKHKYLSETFHFDENDTNVIIGDKPKESKPVKTKTNVRQSAKKAI